MAYFAELDENNNVIRCVSIADNDCIDENGIESEAIGIASCQRIFGTPNWKQTSYSRRIRLNFASAGMLYIPDRDIFVYPPPHPWYVLDDNNQWVSPIGVHPETGEILQDWQWRFLEVAYKLNPSYDDFRRAVKQQEEEGLPNV